MYKKIQIWEIWKTNKKVSLFVWMKKLWFTYYRNKEGIQNFLSNIYINEERLVINGEI